MQGTLCKFQISTHGGFGFILAEGEIFFVHCRDIAKGIPACGCPVSFVPQPPVKGQYRQAKQVEIDNSRFAPSLPEVAHEFSNKQKVMKP